MQAESFFIDCNMERECLLLVAVSQLILGQGNSTSAYGRISTESTTTYAAQTTTELISPGISESPHKSYLGVGVAIGVSVMLIVDAICLALAFIFRYKLAARVAGTKETSDTHMSRVQISSPVAITGRDQTQSQEDRSPAASIEYEALQRENVEAPHTYEQMHFYQNL
ncbi:uncharacterized protein LOC124147993 isoform X2 [Haliotis rufescens]|uniref:uncharacterized protein LOC124147993 isoform X2 n=1 Tax=Haliotis rufescens TaxID=6454 RepID=UPI00201EC991|nr:uncharacterized protein LOC124147993 isoform X2 [Haliotis rufescens]